MTTRSVSSSRSWACRFVFGAALAVLVLAGGCDKPEKPCAVAGQVLVNDRPAYGVYVVFHAAGNTPNPPSFGSARTNQDGSFSLRLRAPGEYAVTVFWPKVTVEAGESVEGEDFFQNRHRDPQRPVQKVAIQEGENALPPIQLSSR